MNRWKRVSDMKCKRTPGICCIFAFILLIAGTVHVRAQTQQKRNRGEGFYKCISANTPGHGDIWVTGRAIGFIWDDDPDDAARAKILDFIEADIDIGLYDIFCVSVQSRPFYPVHRFEPGWVGGMLKATIPDNKDLRLNGFGMSIRYNYNMIKDPKHSLGGFRNGGTGFMPEGFMVEGSTVEAKFLYDLDVIAKISALPFKLLFNAGVRVPFDREYLPYSQYLLDVGLAYVGVGADFFVEYSIEGFVNKSMDPKQFRFDWGGWGGEKVWEVAFSENPMFVTPGVRIRYENGVCLSLAVPVLLSLNQGSSMGEVGNDVYKYTDEMDRGVTDGFDPWFAKWKIAGSLSFPLRSTITSAEMMRNFLMMKNRKQQKRIDIDNRLQNLENKAPSQADEDADRQKRLEEIRKRREQMQSDE
jgi:hypothetical protein